MVQESNIGSNKVDFMKFAFKFHKTMKENNLSLAYEGEVTQQLMKAFTSMAEINMDKSSEEERVKKKVFHVMVECLQNICKHADHIVTGEPVKPGSGLFLIGRENNDYLILSGNPVSKDKVGELTAQLEQINALDIDGVKALYKKQIKASILSEKAGAGLGLIDMAKKTKQKLNFHFEPINDKTSFFLLSLKIVK